MRHIQSFWVCCLLAANIIPARDQIHFRKGSRTGPTTATRIPDCMIAQEAGGTSTRVQPRPPPAPCTPTCVQTPPEQANKTTVQGLEYKTTVQGLELEYKDWSNGVRKRLVNRSSQNKWLIMSDPSSNNAFW
jgi:hypothetical protein